MDQVKQILAVMKKQHFWILTGLVIIITSVGYLLARMSLDKTIAERKAKVDAAYGSVQKVASAASSAPNEFSHKKMQEILDSVATNVADAWTLQYDRQKSLFTWPDEAIAPEEREATHAKLAKLLPIELLDMKDKEPLTKKELNVYRDYIKEVFPKIVGIIGAEWTAEMKSGESAAGMSSMPGSSSGSGMLSGSSGAMGGGSGMLGGGSGYPGGGSGIAGGINPRTMRKGPLVEWPTASQQELVGAMCSWYNPSQTPKTIEICYTQEDLWILEGIMRIIAATNGDARENFQAAIKEIDYIRFGRTAQGQAGELKGLAGGGMAGMPSGMPGMPGAGGSMPGSGGAMPGGYGGGANAGTSAAKAVAKPDPAEGRYVDQNMEMVTAAKIRSAIKTGSKETASLAVAKRIPVRIRFGKMDQRKINTFLKLCGEAQLVLEVKQVRINASPVTLGQGGGIGGGTGGGAFGDGARPTLGSAGGSTVGLDNDTAAGGGGGVAQTKMDFGGLYDLPVEFYGIIYLYNPVDLKKLGLSDKKAKKEAPAKGDAPAKEGTNPAAPAAANSNTPATPAPSTPAPAANPKGDAATTSEKEGSATKPAEPATDTPTPDAGGDQPPPAAGQPGDADDR